ncbi:hypothetical protein Tco_0786470 [Tanacetum coccineum]
MFLICCVRYVQEVLEISKVAITSPSDLMIDSRSLSFTPFRGSDFLIEEIDAFLEHDDSIPPGIDGIYDSEGDTVYLEELLNKMLQRCEDTNLVLNWEKCHFMVKEGIVLGHKISKSGIEVDKTKRTSIAKLASSRDREGSSEFSRSCWSLPTELI